MPKRPGLLFIVENDAAIRMALHRMLSAFGWEVRLFSSSYYCFQAALDQQPACILIDLHPLGMNLVELLEALRSGEVICPMVVLTPYVDSPLAAAARAAGVFAILEKTCDASTLDNTLRIAAMC